MKIYLTTDKMPSGDVYGCYVWVSKPILNRHGWWAHGCRNLDGVLAGYFPKQDLATLGFPPPGKLRVVELGEYVVWEQAWQEWLESNKHHCPACASPIVYMDSQFIVHCSSCGAIDKLMVEETDNEPAIDEYEEGE